VWIGALVLAVAFATLIALLGFRSSRRLGAQPTRTTSVVRRVLRSSNRPAVDDGIRAAYSTNRGTGLVVALAGSAVAVFLAAVVFGASLSALTSTPASYGWPWDVGVVGNFGYGGMNTRAIAASLDHRDDVRSWSALGFANSVTLDGDAVPSVFSFDRVSTIDVAVVEGHLPTAADEVALGARTAAEHGLRIGDEVTVAGYEVSSRRATVKGIVVLPALGPFQADRAAPGEGMLIPQAMIKKSTDTGTVSFVGIEIAPGADRKATVARIRHESGSWVPPNVAVARYANPVRPAEIIDAHSVRNAPLLVGGLLAVAATVGLAAGIVISVRSRRHEMAVLRTLGFTGRQLRSSVRVQGLAMMFGGFVVGAPLGVAFGRFAWRAFASRLGVVPAASTPIGWIVATAAGAALVAVFAAAGPARVAARTKPAARLRSE
jgi:putative ABC transport system permease protein